MAALSSQHQDLPPTADGISDAHIAFPQTIEEFDSDPRISYSKLEEKYILEEENGNEWEWQPAIGEEAKTGKGRWVPSVDESLLEQQRQAYGVDEANDEAVTGKQKKRKYADGNGTSTDSKRNKPNQPARERKNTAVYITKLPPDTNEAEVEHTFSRCGLIANSIDTGKPRIKLYTNDDGSLKGDALVIFFRPESIQLAVDLMDGAEFRLGDKETIIGVKEADMNYMRSSDSKNAPEDNGKSKAQSAREKQKIKARTQAMNEKLADWDDDDPQTLPETNSRWDKVVVLKHMFTMKELTEDANAISDIKEDIEGESSKFGDVTNITLYDKEEDGIITVRFGNPESAKACVRNFNGRYFGGQTVEAYISKGKENFKKTKEKKGRFGDDEDDEETRLDDFGDWLEQGHDSKLGDEIR